MASNKSRWVAKVSTGPRMSVTFEASSGSLASGAESATIAVAHGLGVAPDVVVGHLRDGTWAAQVGWRVASMDSTNVNFRFLNHGPNTATGILRFRLIY